MQGEQYAITAKVRILAPFNAFDQPPELTDAQLGPFIEAITVNNAVDEPFGRFSIDVSPLPFANGLSLVDIVQPYSLVSIAFHRAGRPRHRYDTACTAEPESIMLGVVDVANASEDYQTAEPQRRLQITGRALTSVLSDHKWWFHHYLASAIDPEQLPPDVREFFEVRPGDAALRDEATLRTLGFLAVDPNLFDVANRAPIELMLAAWRFFVVGAPDRDPFIKCTWQKGQTLDQLLRFDGAAAQASYFDPRARMVSQYLPTEMPNSSCWDLLKYFSAEHFNELFSDTFGSDLRNPRVEVISRKPPFAGAVSYGTGRVRIAFADGGTRPRDGASLFDTRFGAWDRQRDTVVIDGNDFLGMPSLERSINQGVYSLYDVQPAVFANAGAGTGERFFQQEIPPIIDEVVDSPSYVRRYGLRPLRVTTRTIGVLELDDETPTPIGDIRDQCLVYAALLREWHFRAPLFWRGSFILKGQTALRAGRRLVDRTTRREYYITRVVHRMTFGAEPDYVTTVQVERGWDLAEGVV